MIKKYILKNWPIVLLYLLFASFAAWMNVHLATILQDITNTAVAFDLDSFWDQIIFAGLYFISFGIVMYGAELTYILFIRKVMKKVRADVFSGLMKRNVAKFEEVNSADYISAMNNDMKLLETNFFEALANSFMYGVMFIAAVGYLVYLSWQVAGGLLGTLIILVIVPALFGIGMKKRQTYLSESESRFTVKIKDIFSGFEVIKSFGMQKKMEQSFKGANDDLIKTAFKFNHLTVINSSVSAVIGLFMQVGVVFFAAWLIINGHMSVGTMVAILVVSGTVVAPVSALGQLVPLVTGSKEIVERLEAFMTAEHETSDRIATFDHDITVKSLTYTYPDGENPVLNRVNFTFEKNKKYALVGKSGCGKTTLAKTVIGQIKGYEGEILYDGQKLEHLKEASYIALSSIVHQNVYMFDSTIEENITLGRDVNKKELAMALENSGVNLFLDEERTLQSAVGENGNNLSGGQRQRIAVARALVGQKPLLVLDEGTSALDRETARDIETRLLKQEELTLITITHADDETLLSQYDAIVYMEDGHIINVKENIKLVC